MAEVDFADFQIVFQPVFRLAATPQTLIAIVSNQFNLFIANVFIHSSSDHAGRKQLQVGAF